MYLDIAILIYLALLCIIGFWKGLARQVLLAVSLAGAAVTVYIFRDNLLAAMAAGFNTRGFAARLVLLVAIFLLGFIIHRLLAFLAKPLLRSRRGLPGAIFALLRGLAAVVIFLVLCDLAYPTFELRLPAVAKALRESVIFRGTQTFDRSEINPLAKWSTYIKVRDIFLSPVDYDARVRLQEDQGYRNLQETESLVALNGDKDYIAAVQEGRLCDAARNPKLLAFLNDDDAYRAFQTFLWSSAEVEQVDRVETSLFPPGASDRRVGKELDKRMKKQQPEPVKIIILKNGSRMKGIIRAQNEHEIEADVVIGNDLIRAIFKQDEIRDIRDIDEKL